MTLEVLASPRTTPAAGLLLAVHDAHKRFGATEALRGASLELREGELLGLLGPNGAGKTTLIRAIAGRVKLDCGEIVLLGSRLAAKDPRPELGVVPQEIALYALLTARENLEVFGRLHGVSPADLKPRVDWALSWTALGDRAKEPVKGFSGGMKRRLNIACGVLHRPRVALLDEPTVGVDPQSRERIYGMLAELRAEGTSLVLTTHQLDEAEAHCDRVAIIDHGRLVACGTARELVSKHIGTARIVRLSFDTMPRELPAGAAIEDGQVVARVNDIGAELPALIEAARRAGARVVDVQVDRQGLHEVFLQLTGKELRE